MNKEDLIVKAVELGIGSQEELSKYTSAELQDKINAVNPEGEQPKKKTGKLAKLQEENARLREENNKHIKEIDLLHGTIDTLKEEVIVVRKTAEDQLKKEAEENYTTTARLHQHKKTGKITILPKGVK